MAANDERKAGVMSDKNGNVYKMRDYELLEQSEAQTIGNTDYFVLEDVNGGYHKILKSSVMGVIREALGELVNSRDKATEAKSALVLDNNNDLGTSSISALAQMLGGVKNVRLDGALVDANTMIEQGKIVSYTFNQDTFENFPSGATGTGLLLSIGPSNHGAIQFYFDAQTVIAAFRYSWTSGTIAGDWHSLL